MILLTGNVLSIKFINASSPMQSINIILFISKPGKKMNWENSFIFARCLLRSKENRKKKQKQNFVTTEKHKRKQKTEDSFFSHLDLINISVGWGRERKNRIYTDKYEMKHFQFVFFIFLCLIFEICTSAQV